MYKKISVFFLSIASFLLIASNALAFTDVIPQSLFYSSVNYFSHQIPIIDLSRDKFEPLKIVNKAEFYTLIFRSAGYTANGTGSFSVPYHDVQGDEWFATYIKKALDAGLITYSEDNPNLNPTGHISRIDGIKQIFRLYGINSSDFSSVESRYRDVNADDQNYAISKAAFGMQLLTDQKSGLFSANKDLKKAEIVNILYQLHVNGFNKSNLVKPSFVVNTSEISEITDEEAFRVLTEVWEKILEDYVDQGEIDKEELVYSAISGMVAGLNDPFSKFFTPQDAEDYIANLNGSFDGIGIYLDTKDDQYVIISPLKGTPAEKAGLKPNDIILQLNGKPTANMTFDQVLNELRGEAGTLLKITIRRSNATKNYSIKRQTIDIPYVESEIIGNVGIIKYYQFTSNSNEQFVKELNNVVAKNPRGLILDLRHNPGGYLYSSQEMLSHFLTSGQKFITLEYAGNYRESEFSFGPGELSNTPVVILINKGSASASEIVALALRDQMKAKIVGTTSFGKGHIQEIIDYFDGSTLKLTIAKWYSPNGTYIEEVGITPDYIVELTDLDIQNNEDPQLDKALSLITQ